MANEMAHTYSNSVAAGFVPYLGARSSPENACLMGGGLRDYVTLSDFSELLSNPAALLAGAGLVWYLCKKKRR